MLDVRPMQPGDYVQAHRAANPESAYTVAQLLNFGWSYHDSGPAFSGWVGSHLVGCAGLVIPWRGRADGWAVLTPLGKTHAGIVHRTIVRRLRDLIVEHDLRRIQGDTFANYMTGCAWLTRLGLQFESLMPLYGPNGETFARYAWLRPGYAQGEAG